MKEQMDAVYTDPIRILVADDERMFRNLIHRSLTDEGFEVRVAANGNDAVGLLEKEKFDLVITDINMPGIDGMEVTRTAKSINPESEVIIITGYASLDSALEAIRTGVYDYIVKPFQLEEIELTVGNAIEKIRLIRQNHDLLDKLDQAHLEIAELMKNQRENVNRFNEISTTLETRRKELEQGVHSLMNLQSRLLPFQYVYEEKRCMPVVDRIQRLAELRQQGSISDDEYEKMKFALLEGLR